MISKNTSGFTSNTLLIKFPICEDKFFLEKIKAMFQKIYFRNVIAIVLVLRNLFIVSYGIAICIREITRGSVLYHYLMTNELVYDQMNTLYNKIVDLPVWQILVELITVFFVH